MNINYSLLIIYEPLLSIYEYQPVLNTEAWRLNFVDFIIHLNYWQFGFFRLILS